MTGRLNVPFGVLSVTTRTLLSFPGWVSVITAVGQCSGVVLSSFNRTRSPGCRLGMSSAIVDAAAGSGGSQMTISVRTVEFVVGRFATWKVSYT